MVLQISNHKRVSRQVRDVRVRGLLRRTDGSLVTVRNKGQKRTAELGIVLKPDPKKSVGNNVIGAITTLFLARNCAGCELTGVAVMAGK